MIRTRNTQQEVLDKIQEEGWNFYHPLEENKYDFISPNGSLMLHLLHFFPISHILYFKRDANAITSLEDGYLLDGWNYLTSSSYEDFLKKGTAEILTEHLL